MAGDVKERKEPETRNQKPETRNSKPMSECATEEKTSDFRRRTSARSDARRLRRPCGARVVASRGLELEVTNRGSGTPAASALARHCEATGVSLPRKGRVHESVRGQSRRIETTKPETLKLSNLHPPQTFRAHLSNSPPSLLMIGNNYLKQHIFGARANSLVPIVQSKTIQLYQGPCKHRWIDARAS